MHPHVPAASFSVCSSFCFKEWCQKKELHICPLSHMWAHMCTFSLCAHAYTLLDVGTVITMPFISFFFFLQLRYTFNIPVEKIHCWSGLWANCQWFWTLLYECTANRFFLTKFHLPLEFINKSDGISYFLRGLDDWQSRSV